MEVGYEVGNADGFDDGADVGVEDGELEDNDVGDFVEITDGLNVD